MWIFAQKIRHPRGEVKLQPFFFQHSCWTSSKVYNNSSIVFNMNTVVQWSGRTWTRAASPSVGNGLIQKNQWLGTFSLTQEGGRSQRHRVMLTVAVAARSLCNIYTGWEALAVSTPWDRRVGGRRDRSRRSSLLTREQKRWLFPLCHLGNKGQQLALGVKVINTSTFTM